jgi:hypothetical protein
MQERSSRGNQNTWGNQNTSQGKKGYRSVLNRIIHFSLRQMILAFMAVGSFQNYIKSLFVRDKVVVNTAYKDEPILLLALYEKSILRPDIVNLLKVAKKLGLYTITVNTQKLTDTELSDKKKLIDTYLGVFNFGRDFGSYKKGFNYIFNRGLHKHAPRIVMLNDSVFYEPSRLEPFLKELVITKKEVLGATHNYEINYHIGSFCISFAKSITNNKRFISYWKNFRRTDLRRNVICRGEMGLSKAIQKIASNESSISVIYNQAATHQFLNNSQTHLEKWVELLRDSTGHWECKSLGQIFNEFLEHKNILFSNEGLKNENNARDRFILMHKRKIVEHDFSYVHSLWQVEKIFKKYNKNEYFNHFKKYLIEELTQQSRYGSQIHQNNACFVYMGMPFIKLDGLYRGVFSDTDINNFSSLMTQKSFEEMQSLIYARPFGEYTHSGWKRIAFMNGLI